MGPARRGAHDLDEARQHDKAKEAAPCPARSSGTIDSATPARSPRAGRGSRVPAPRGGRIDLRAAWEAVRNAPGLPEGLRIHDLRHTFASLAVSAGVPLRTIGGLLGHSAVATTARYAHLQDGDLAAAAGAVHA